MLFFLYLKIFLLVSREIWNSETRLRSRTPSIIQIRIYINPSVYVLNTHVCMYNRFCNCVKETDYTFISITYARLFFQKRSSFFLLTFGRVCTNYGLAQFDTISGQNINFIALFQKDGQLLLSLTNMFFGG